MIVDVAGAAAALQAADDILILTHRRPDGDTGRLCQLHSAAVCSRLASKRIYSGKSGDHQTLCAADRAVLSAGGFCSGVCGFRPILLREAVSGHGRAVQRARSIWSLTITARNDGFGKNLIRPDAGGCAEVLYDVLTALGVKFTADIAECIYIGVSTDTGCFKFSEYDRAFRMR